MHSLTGMAFITTRSHIGPGMFPQLLLAPHRTQKPEAFGLKFIHTVVLSIQIPQTTFFKRDKRLMILGLLITAVIYLVQQKWFLSSLASFTTRWGGRYQLKWIKPDLIIPALLLQLFADEPLFAVSTPVNFMVILAQTWVRLGYRHQRMLYIEKCFLHLQVTSWIVAKTTLICLYIVLE